MKDQDKSLLFQQWKRFIDSEISILVLGTTHRAVDIANSNKDLIGRVRQIDVLQWSLSDLEKICDNGFSYIGVEIAESIKKKISKEAVGLPIIVQQACLQLFENKGLSKIVQARKKRVAFSMTDANDALHDVANNKYTQFRSYYDTLVKGPREKARKYKTYELIIGCFTRDPIKFSLSRKEVDQRVTLLCEQDEIPPPASMNSTFGALKKFQERRKFELLEWMPNEENLYIIEPSFLFFVRWRRRRVDADQLDFLEELLRDL